MSYPIKISVDGMPIPKACYNPFFELLPPVAYMLEQLHRLSCILLYPIENYISHRTHLVSSPKGHEMSKVSTLEEWKAKYAANERAEAAKMAAYGRLTREQRLAAIAHLQEMHPGRERIYWSQEILEAHIELGMGAKK